MSPTTVTREVHNRNCAHLVYIRGDKFKLPNLDANPCPITYLSRDLRLGL